MIRMKVWFVLAVLVIIGPSRFAQATALTVTGSMKDRSCLIRMLNPTAQLGTHSASEFTANNGTAAVETIQFEVYGCDMPDQSNGDFLVWLSPGSGTVASGAGTVAGAVFTNSQANTTGFMFRRMAVTRPGDALPDWMTKNNASLSDYYNFENQGGMVGGVKVSIGKFGHVPADIDDGTFINFAVGFVQTNINIPPSAETVSVNAVLNVEYK